MSYLAMGERSIMGNSRLKTRRILLTSALFAAFISERLPDGFVGCGTKQQRAKETHEPEAGQKK